MSEHSPICPPSVLRAADRIRTRITADASPTVLTACFGAETDPEAIRIGVAEAGVALLVGPSAARDTAAFEEQLAAVGISPEFVGRTRLEDPNRTIAIFRGPSPPVIGPAPPSFRAVAIIVAYNEQDVIAESIAHLIKQGVDVYLMDNWSTDETVAVALHAAGSHLAGWERFPRCARSKTFDYSAVLLRVQDLATELDADWIICNDADELRVPPWDSVSLRDGLFHAQQTGFTAVNYSTLNFTLTEDVPSGAQDLESRFFWFDPQRVPDLSQLNTWRQPSSQRVDLESTGHHRVGFPGRRIFPFNFLLKHYPIRSVEHGMRKINTDRLPRYRTDERLRGWHGHYRPATPRTLINHSPDLLRFDEEFARSFLLERLTGVGFEPQPSPITFTLKVARTLRRAGLLDVARRIKWRLSP
ncbi:MAG TPA: glycosyltransferase family 2 protein [Acidimicrobiales bacterium]|jgi:hypothetical protein|nr:glycosyltransferase family 2 protein [Acidimicrobiales bacterium]